MFDFSVITPSFNSSNTILQTIKSVQNQKDIEIEHLIIDGLSNDNTHDVVKPFLGKINNISTYWFSQKDLGVYDAMNKGLKMANGKMIAILNSDDVFNSNDNLLYRIYEIYKNGYDVVYGDLIIKDQFLEKTLRTWRVGKYKENSFSFGWHPAHPSFFSSKYVYDKIGYFDLDFRIASDFDMMMRILTCNLFKPKYISETTTIMRTGGLSSSGPKNILIGGKEIIKSFKKNNIKRVWYYPIIRYISKLSQYFNK